MGVLPSGFQDRRIQPLCHSSVFKYNVQPPLAGLLVTVLNPLAAFWCTLPPRGSTGDASATDVGVDSCDPLIYVEVVLGVVGVALPANVVPARRAAAVDPRRLSASSRSGRCHRTTRGERVSKGLN